MSKVANMRFFRLYARVRACGVHISNHHEHRHHRKVVINNNRGGSRGSSSMRPRECIQISLNVASRCTRGAAAMLLSTIKVLHIFESWRLHECHGLNEGARAKRWRLFNFLLHEYASSMCARETSADRDGSFLRCVCVCVCISEYNLRNSERD